MTAHALQFYGEIQKFDSEGDGSLMVSGIVSTEARDADGEVVTADAMRKAIPTYLQKYGAVREMHQPIAAGTPVSLYVGEDNKTYITAKIVDSETIKKIKAGVLKGFSIGGNALKKTGKTIVELLLKEISLVDLPNNPEALFTVIKFDKPEDKCNDDRCKTHTEPMKKCKHCDEPMEKCGGNCDGAKTEKAHMKKVDDLTLAVDALTKGFEAFKTASAQPIKIKFGDEELPMEVALTKALNNVGELQKKATETQKQVEANERAAIIAKMDVQCRVAFNPETNVAYTAEELGKMDLTLLKVLAVNSPTLPDKARAVYKGAGKPQVDPKLTGSDKTAALWEARFPSLDIVKAQMGHTN